MRNLFLIGGVLIGFVLGYAWRPKTDRAPAEAAAPTPPAAKGSCAHDASTFRCVKFDHNYDGDTITFQIPDVPPILGKNISVRVFGIDTPEMKGKSPCEKDRAREAKDLVTGLLAKAKHIELRHIQRDKYFRILADVVADEVSISEKLMNAKLAYPYDGGTKAKVNWCQLASRQ